MKTLLSLLTTLTLFGCREADIETQPQPQQGPVQVYIALFAPEAEALTRTDEGRIADANLFLADRTTREVRQYYTQNATAQFSCTPGYYDLYVVANLHADTGYMTYDELMACTVAEPATWDELIMTAIKPLSVQPANETQNPETVSLVRFAARICYQVSVASSVPDIEVRSVQAMSLPRRASLFSDAKPVLFTDGTLLNTHEGEFYMLPNCQGSVENITRPQDRNPDNAPAGATCLRIRAVRGSRVLDYFVYPGDNGTSDFNVRPNTLHNLNITIRGDNELDVRMRYYAVQSHCSIDAEPEQGIYTQTAPITLEVGCSGNYHNLGLRAELTMRAGDPACFSCNGSSGMLTYDLGKITAPTVRFTLDYQPASFTLQNTRLSFAVNIYDRYGIVLTFTHTFHFADRIRVYTSWYVNGTRCGDPNSAIRSEEAQLCVRGNTLSASYFDVFCTSEGCTLEAVPSYEGEYFGGFFTGHNLTGLLSGSNVWRYDPATTYLPVQTLYAYFI